MSAAVPPPAKARASRVYDGVDKAYTLAGLLRAGARSDFKDDAEVDGFRSAVELVAGIIEKTLEPLLDDAVRLSAGGAQ